MGISINVRDMDQDMNDIKAGGFSDVPEGRGLVQISEYKERAGKQGQDLMKLVLMAWSVPRGQGMEHMEGLLHDKPDAKFERYEPRILRIAVATGVVTPQELQAARDGAGTVNIETHMFVGRLMFAEIGKVEGFGKNKGKFFTNVLGDGNLIFHIKDPRCAEWPTNPGVIANFGTHSGDWRPAQETATASPANQPPANGGSPFGSR